MSKVVIQANIQTLNGNISVAPNASISIRDANTASLVSLWTDRAGTIAASNPLTADANGFFRVYATSGRVNITATYGSLSQVWNDVVLNEDTASLPTQKLNDFRLTLTSALPVTSADVIGATTIYCAPYKGNNISLYDGISWNVRASTEMSIAIGTLASATIPQDVFCYDNAGTPTLELLAWSTVNTRTTALIYQDGILVKSGAVTRRYLGTFCPTSTTTTEDSSANRYLWNYSNRVPRLMLRHDTTASWTYAVNTFRQANASTSNQLNFFIGYVEDMVSANLISSGYTSVAGNVMIVALGLNSTTVASGEYYRNVPSTINESKGMSAALNTYPILGKNYIAWLERAQATATFYGWDGVYAGSGMSGGLLA